MMLESICKWQWGGGEKQTDQNVCGEQPLAERMDLLPKLKASECNIFHILKALMRIMRKNADSLRP